MHDPLQATRPLPQDTVHAPLEHTCPAGQTVVQLPQCCGSVWKLVQKAAAPEPQAFGVKAGHEQELDAQLWPMGHTLPQRPQLLASLVVVAQ
jgi:hypothetical protein